MVSVVVWRPLSQWSLPTVVKSQNLQGLFCGKESFWVFSSAVQGDSFVLCSLCPHPFLFIDLWNKRAGMSPKICHSMCFSGRHCWSSRGWRVAHCPLVCSHGGHFVGMLQVSRAFAFRKETWINSVHPDGFSGLLSRTLPSAVCDSISLQWVIVITTAIIFIVCLGVSPKLSCTWGSSCH